MPKKQGDRLNAGEIKSSILKFTLENEGPVGEPAIRDFLLKRYDIMDQGNINRHLHDLQKLDCIELIPPEKKGLRNYWEIKKLKNLRNIKYQFPEVRLNDYEKSINVVLRDLEYYHNSPDWLNYYLKLLLSTSFFNACIETGGRELNNGNWKVYITSVGSQRHQRIDKLLKLCYSTCIKHYSEFKMSENEFMNIVKAHPWEIYRFFAEDVLLKWFEKEFAGLPKEIPLKIFETKLSETGEVPEIIPEEITKEDLVRYILDAMRLRMEEKLEFKFLSDNLLLEHFLHHDMLLGVDSPEELYFVNKTKENHTLPRGSTISGRVILREAELADLRLASEMILKYKQPSIFSFDTADEIYKAVLDHYSLWQIRL
ncbi:hypothetical protein [Methanosarcina sp. UBA411]|jgi:hypothetical protein|uniref:hypothetical protein n=1 Tax=Methanosarcina sp. UBA411 TaxID=1915589 RepID=UPI0025E6C2F3|nr:hypothetical protein [Methanosarcina sp. UBA411]